MMSPKVLVTALLSAAACVAEVPVAGKWSCTNVSDTGSQGRWTLQIKEEGNKLTGSLTDGEVQLPLSDVKIDNGALTFRFHINEKPYTFQGKADARSLEGKYSGEEASGRLRCERPASE